MLYKIPTLVVLAIVWYLQCTMLASANQVSLDVKQQYASDDGDVLNGDAGDAGDAGDDELALLSYATSTIDLGPVAHTTNFNISNRTYKNIASQSRAPPKSH
ncbi:MAG: hypothetical protein GW763_00630 [Paraglaciecola sp.]|nr:hypothetical protein [Paraglaciecola sp.]NCT46497.1 hypothetical protein [Paraglaciecola sp.]